MQDVSIKLTQALCLFVIIANLSALSFEKESIKKVKRSLVKFHQKTRNLQENCGASSDEIPDHDNHEHSRHPRFASRTRRHNAKLGSAAYFTGEDDSLELLWRDIRSEEIPRETFTVELWIKPEGGQKDPAIIIGLINKCANSKQLWALGIQTVGLDGTKDSRIFFSVSDQRTRSNDLIFANKKYQVNRWTHVAATYDGSLMKLYVDKVMVASSDNQHGALFDGDINVNCLVVSLGSDFEGSSSYRGSMEELKIWKLALEHEDVLQLSQTRIAAKSLDVDNIFIYESFDYLRKFWSPIDEEFPVTQPSDLFSKSSNEDFVPPKCGRTVCDNPDIIRSYSANPELRLMKTVRYRVVNVANSDGSNPQVTKEQIRLQHKKLNNVFREYNILWQLEEHVVNNSTIRNKVILFTCDQSQIGNGVCEPECDQDVTGHDGGDCETERSTVCQSHLVDNNECNPECNTVSSNWDGGDCCKEASSITCSDPNSPYRSYISLSEYKTAINLDGESQLNIYFASVDYYDFADVTGIATFPWDKEIYSVLGGIVLQPERYGQPGHLHNMIHEIGHSLGLWHVFHGVSELSCTDPCWEFEASLETGDLCEDTNPTIKAENSSCSDPAKYESICGMEQFYNTPFRNYMGYEDEDCTNEFTPQQVARMHCYLDLKYQTWQQEKRPSPIPLAPFITTATDNSVWISWISPMGKGAMQTNTICNDCMLFGSLKQYASSAVAHGQGFDQYSGLFSPIQATGPPDSQSCDVDTRAWLAYPQSCEAGCSLELEYAIPVVPVSISVWVVHGAAFVDSIQLVYEDSETYDIGPLSMFCDMPFTATLSGVNKKVHKVLITVFSSITSIDAVQLTSRPGHHACADCTQLKYRVIREPELPMFVNTEDTTFVDYDVLPGISYEYRVVAISGIKQSSVSPSLTYIHGETYCGDGEIDRDREEECDDGNTKDGDGCSTRCKLEKFFRCRGEPSYCYLHDGDGFCEDFERQSSVKDCGYYTPSGFSDQWATTAEANSEYERSECPADVVTGPAHPHQSCGKVDYSSSWMPCGFKDANQNNSSNYWLKVGFERAVVAVAVVLHLSADGITVDSSKTRRVLISLIDSEGEKHALRDERVSLTCRNNPLTIHVIQDLTMPFFETKEVLMEFDSPHVAISGIRLRSSKFLDPVTLASCPHGALYDPRLQKCVQYDCKVPECSPLTVHNANVTCDGQSEGDFCTVRCQKGFYSNMGNEEDIVQCLGSSWSPNILCKAVICGKPEIAHAETNCPDGVTLGKNCTYKCVPPARMEGVENEISCLDDGAWSTPSAKCIVRCQTPPAPSKAVMSRKHACREESYDVGSQCRFKCISGYHVVGKANSRRSFRMHCSARGVWTSEQCERVYCPAPHITFTGLYYCSNDFAAGSVCTLKCPGKLELPKSIRCGLNGEWIGSFNCAIFERTACDPPEMPSEISLTCPIKPTVGKQCSVECIDQEKEPQILIENRLEKIYNIVCTGQKTWAPSLNQVICADNCDEEAIGDGFCDRGNNHAACQWDGGDCCEDTVEGGVVIPIPVQCGKRCLCLDPSASENAAALYRFRSGFKHKTFRKT